MNSKANFVRARIIKIKVLLNCQIDEDKFFKLKRAVNCGRLFLLNIQGQSNEMFYLHLYIVS
jgi:hypothetical protein